METRSPQALPQLPVRDVSLLGNSPTTTPLIAQQFEDNLFSNVQGTFNHFVESGQVWALLLGLLIGYMIRSLTAY